jgi:hypothetical protein
VVRALPLKAPFLCSFAAGSNPKLAQDHSNVILFSVCSDFVFTVVLRCLFLSSKLPWAARGVGLLVALWQGHPSAQAAALCACLLKGSSLRVFG